MKKNETRRIILLDDDGKNQELRVGDWVGFKYDIEQSCKIVAIDFSKRLITVEATEGEYAREAGGTATIDLQAGDFWID